MTGKFPKLDAWEAGAAAPKMRQLEEFAKATYVPIGFLFLTEPPVEELPVPDFRTFRDEGMRWPSPDLLETIYACELRQDWYREFARGSCLGTGRTRWQPSPRGDPLEAAAQLRDALGFGLARRVEYRTWTEALSGLVEHAEDAGILVMISGIVGSNTHRPLDPKEFRGFSLVDEMAPVVFINGADTKAAQIFSLAHELAHIALGGSAVSRLTLRVSTRRTTGLSAGAIRSPRSCSCRWIRSGRSTTMVATSSTN